MILTGIAPDEKSSPSELRRQAFVDAARTGFFAAGYAGTTMSSIAAAVGGSKTTLWSYFRSKEELFIAVVDDIVDRYGSALSVEMLADWPPEDALRRFGNAMMATILSQPIIELHRLVTGEAGRFPELAALFYERGPKRGKDKLTVYLTAAMAQGKLRDGDPQVATRHFASMCQSGCYQHVILGFHGPPTPEQVADDVEAALQTFMRAWAV
jgi:TetR/AcrR family transcriptional regulator, mexJK operon transcriptional repressor